MLTSRLLAGGVLLFGLAGTAFHWNISHALRGESDEALRLAAQPLMASVEQKSRRVKIEIDVDDIPEYKDPRASSVFLLKHERGAEITRSPSLGNQVLALPVVTGSDPVYFDADLADQRRLRCMVVRFDAPMEDPSYRGQKGSSLLVVTGRDRLPLELTLSKFRNSLSLTGAGTLALLAGFLWWGVRKGLEPLDQLVTDISAMDARQLSTRFPQGGLPLELQPITARLNGLLERLEKVFLRERRFTADVAHELRTPLAELRTLAEVNLMVPPETAEAGAACWQEVESVAGRMESLALRLLEIARSEQGSQAIERHRFAIAPVIDTVWKRMATAAAERRISLVRDISPDMEGETDPVLFEAIVTNLIGNAVHHATSGSVLKIGTTRKALLFTNEVANLDAKDLEFLFERFWKKDASRTDGRRHGLGLSLARDLAAMLGGSLTARMPSGSSLEFMLRLPLLQAPGGD